MKSARTLLHLVPLWYIGIHPATLWPHPFSKALAASQGQDNIFAFGSMEQKNDKNLAGVIERARQKSIVFNKDKLQFKCKGGPFLWPHLNPQGVKSDNSKVVAIQSMQPRRCQEPTELPRPSKLPNKVISSPGHHYSTSPWPRKEGRGLWVGPRANRAFAAVKKEVSTLGLLRYFDPKAQTVIQTDASLKGLGAELLHQSQPGSTRVLMHLRRLLAQSRGTATLSVKHWR